MQYADTTQVNRTSVDDMFGLVRVKDVMRAVALARQDANEERVRDLTSGTFRDEIIAAAKRAGEASRPVSKGHIAQDKPLNNG